MRGREVLLLPQGFLLSFPAAATPHTQPDPKSPNPSDHRISQGSSTLAARLELCNEGNPCPVGLIWELQFAWGEEELGEVLSNHFTIPGSFGKKLLVIHRCLSVERQDQAGSIQEQLSSWIQRQSPFPTPPNHRKFGKHH